MNLWLDDIRRPPSKGIWQWVKNYDEAVKALSTFAYNWVSLDHDLADEHYQAYNATLVDGVPTPWKGDLIISEFREKTGYDVAVWMAENNVWPRKGVRVHTWNSGVVKRMCGVVDRYGPYGERCVHVPAKSMEQG